MSHPCFQPVVQSQSDHEADAMQGENERRGDSDDRGVESVALAAILSSEDRERKGEREVAWTEERARLRNGEREKERESGWGGEGRKEGKSLRAGEGDRGQS